MMTTERTRPEEALAQFLRDGRAAAAFTAAALNDDIWERAKANPRRYFEARGVCLPRMFATGFVNGDPEQPDESRETVVRCWWLTAGEDAYEDGERPRPMRVWIEVPAGSVRPAI